MKNVYDSNMPVTIDLKQLKKMIKEKVYDRNVRYIILIRHASREMLFAKPERSHRMANKSDRYRKPLSNFKKGGLPRTLSIAGRLADELELLAKDRVVVEKIMSSPHRVAVQTAEEFRNVLTERKVCRVDQVQDTQELDPMLANVYNRNQFDKKFWETIIGGTKAHAVAVVGHQPYLTRIAMLFLNRKLIGNVLPIDNSEVALIRIGVNPRLLWLLTSKSQELLNDLKDKVKSKYDVAKFFLGALVVKTGLVLNTKLWEVSNETERAILYTGILFSLISLGMAVATLLSYDSLLMPHNFWGPAKKRSEIKWSLNRPPSQAQPIIYYEMIHTWKCFFIPSLICALAAIICFLTLLAGTKYILASIGIVIIAATCPIYIYALYRPRMGAED